MPAQLIDGDFRRAEPIGPRRFHYPFLSNGDRVSNYFEEDYWQRIETFQPEGRPIRHDELRDYYLMDESDPLAVLGQLCQFTRTYARLPADQITKVRRPLVLPTVTDDGGITYGVTAYQNYASPVVIANAIRHSTGLWLSDGRVYAPFVPYVGLTIPYATAGTFTLTYKSSTTAALAYNASDATVAAAINALASVVSDGLTVTCGNQLGTINAGLLTITVSVGATSSKFTITATGLTLSSGTFKTTISVVMTTTSHYINIARPFVAIAHGFDTAAGICSTNSSSEKLYTMASGEWAVLDADTIGLPYGISASSFQYLAPFLGTYLAGASNPLHTKTERFYLPGVSPGIATVDDIPSYDAALSDEAKLAAFLAAGDGLYVVDFEGPDKYREWPLQRTATLEVEI